MMSDESRAELGQSSSRGEKQDMTRDDYEQGMVRDETALGQRDGNQMDSRQGWQRLVEVRDVVGGSSMKGTGRPFEISRPSAEKSHL